MFALVHKLNLEENFLVLNVIGVCSSKLLKCFINDKEIPTTPLRSGDRVKFDVNKPGAGGVPTITALSRQDFDMCPHCNYPQAVSDAQIMCNECAGLKRCVKDYVKIVTIEKKEYQYGPGVKLAMIPKSNQEDIIHAVVFKNSPFYEKVMEMNEGSTSYVKAEIIQHGAVPHNFLVNIFQLGGFF